MRDIVIIIVSGLFIVTLVGMLLFSVSEIIKYPYKIDTYKVCVEHDKNTHMRNKAYKDLTEVDNICLKLLGNKELQAEGSVK